ncbi:uncharacterized protein MKZ38_000215 [Zalerion maritima]|uniref:PNPLA domain-containing protein n=1 Tax=Zalerion maritima TaxID=339359 RepID=A0AAD5RRR1_9PEZI|nr:uncharacterized protein MKZ38_000215 [Zalerion maritima]
MSSTLSFDVAPAENQTRESVSATEDQVAGSPQDYFAGSDLVWMLMSSALVLLMHPGMSLLLAGASGRRDALAAFKMPLIISAFVGFQWFLWGYAITFSPDPSKADGETSWLGGSLGATAFRDILARPVGGNGPQIPELVFALYQGMFASFTALLVCSGMVGKFQTGRSLLFIAFWSTIVYSPIARWTWHPYGWSRQFGVMDTAGGTPVHIASGASVAAFYIFHDLDSEKGREDLGKRLLRLLNLRARLSRAKKAYRHGGGAPGTFDVSGHISMRSMRPNMNENPRGNTQNPNNTPTRQNPQGGANIISEPTNDGGQETLQTPSNPPQTASRSSRLWPSEENPPHDVNNVALGTALLWIGWLGFNGGSILGGNMRAVSACVSTHVAACAGGSVSLIGSWMLAYATRRLQTRSNRSKLRNISILHLCDGVLAGLVAITPGAGYVPVWSSAVFGIVSTIAVFCLKLASKAVLKDDPLYIFAIHTGGGLVGMFLTGVFASEEIVKLDGYSKWPDTPRGEMIGYQIADALAGFGFAFFATLAILVFFKLVWSLLHGFDRWDGWFHDDEGTSKRTLGAVVQNVWDDYPSITTNAGVGPNGTLLQRDQNTAGREYTQATPSPAAAAQPPSPLSMCMNTHSIDWSESQNAKTLRASVSETNQNAHVVPVDKTNRKQLPETGTRQQEYKNPERLHLKAILRHLVLSLPSTSWKSDKFRVQLAVAPSTSALNVTMETTPGSAPNVVGNFPSPSEAGNMFAFPPAGAARSKDDGKDDTRWKFQALGQLLSQHPLPADLLASFRHLCGKPDNYCIKCREPSCRTKFCKVHKVCWRLHLPRWEDLEQDHSMVEPFYHLFIKAATRSEKDSGRQRQRHQQDKPARWFTIKKDPGRETRTLNIFDRFLKLCDLDQPGGHETRKHYPSFVSFVGDTAAGKSTLVRAMLMTGLARSLPVEGSDSVHENLSALIEKADDGPVTRSGDVNHLKDPTSKGVHLYRDNNLWLQTGEAEIFAREVTGAEFPILFADCEGFRAGTALTNAERTELHPGTERSTSRHGLETLGGSSGTRPEQDRSRSTSPAYPNPNLLDRLPVTARSYTQNGKDGEDLFYARYLYAISDVIVFVTKDDTRMQPELIKVLEWACQAVYRSVNHPSRKTLIIVRNMAGLHDEKLYRTEKLEDLYLNQHSKHWEESKVLKDFVRKYNVQEKRPHCRIDTNRRLYNVLFKQITCCYIPNEMNIKGRWKELYDQYDNLRLMIETSVKEGLKLRAESQMNYNVPSLLHILDQAFLHFTRTEDPFDFYRASRHTIPNPQHTGDHLANFLRIATTAQPSLVENVPDLIYNTIALSFVIQDTRFSSIARNPTEVFEKEFEKLVFAPALKKFASSYESCSFIFEGGSPCITRPETLHDIHMNEEGSIQPGPFQHGLLGNHASQETVMDEVKTRFLNIYHKALLQEGSNEAQAGALRGIREKMGREHAGLWVTIKSNKTCLSCLQSVPDHVLKCGHAYCPTCVQELGTQSANYEAAWEMRQCWLCWTGNPNGPHLVRLRPRCAGSRILSLDGGGIRGIVELAMLRAVFTTVGMNLHIRDFFDLIVGTSTGGIIALGLTMSNYPLKELTTFFKDSSRATFHHAKEGRFFSKIDPKYYISKTLLFFRAFESVFPAESLKESLVRLFTSETSLFAPAITFQPSPTRVAVASAKDYGVSKCLITSYNHPVPIDPWKGCIDDTPKGPPPRPRARQRAITGLEYDYFELEEFVKDDFKVWEAAIATSAAPFYLPPFIKANGAETGSKIKGINSGIYSNSIGNNVTGTTTYVDGALYWNCPAKIAYQEMERLWPGGASNLDILLSLGSGDMEESGKSKLPPLFNLGFLAAIRARFEKALDSKEGWKEFKDHDCPHRDRNRLFRLDPEVGDYVDLFEHEKMDSLEDAALSWARIPSVVPYVRSIASSLIASLFFFEPSEAPATFTSAPVAYQSILALVENAVDEAGDSPQNTQSSHRHPETDVIAGSIRTRLPWKSPDLDMLLRTRISGFWVTEFDAAASVGASTQHQHMVGESPTLDQVASLTDWDEVLAPSSNGVESFAAESGGRAGAETRRFRIPVTLSCERDRPHKYKVVALTLTGEDNQRKIPISGFPATVRELQRRARARWLQ